MNFCPNCGSKLEPNDVFCTKCGTRLVEDVKDVKSENTNKPKEVKETCTLNFTEEFNKLPKLLLKMFVYPVSSSKEFVNTSTKELAIVLTLLLTVLQGFIGMWKVNQLISCFEQIMITVYKNINDFLFKFNPSYSYFRDSHDLLDFRKEVDTFKSFLNVPYDKVFLQNCALFLSSVALIFIITYISTNIFSKNKSNVFIVYKIALIVCIPMLYFEILSIIVSYFSFFIGAAIFIIGFILSIVSLTLSLKELFVTNENHCAFTIAISVTVVLISILFLLNTFIISNILDIISFNKNFIRYLQ